MAKLGKACLYESSEKLQMKLQHGNARRTSIENAQEARALGASALAVLLVMRRWSAKT